MVIAPLEWLTLNSNIQCPKPMSSTLAQGDDRVHPGRAPRRDVAQLNAVNFLAELSGAGEN
jgi:hypothetical protein